MIIARVAVIIHKTGAHSQMLMIIVGGHTHQQQWLVGGFSWSGGEPIDWHTTVQMHLTPEGQKSVPAGERAGSAAHVARRVLPGPEDHITSAD